jgi:hypothetical protein
MQIYNSVKSGRTGVLSEDTGVVSLLECRSCAHGSKDGSEQHGECEMHFDFWGCLVGLLVFCVVVGRMFAVRSAQ